MTDNTNPFVHPAQTRLIELIDEAERKLFDNQDETQPLSDPMERFHVAREWGVDPWVAAMLPVSQELATLQNLAVGIAPDEGIAKAALMSVVTHSLQALALFEEEQDSDQTLDDSQLANFLDRLVTQLDARIEKLRAAAEKVQAPSLNKVPTPEQIAELDKIMEDLKHQNIQPPLVQSVPFLPESATRPITTMEAEDVPLPDEDIQPGLAFTAPHGLIVAGEGNDGTPALSAEQRQVMTEDEPGNEHDDWAAHSDVLNHSHDGRMGRHHHDHEGGARLVIWEGDIPYIENFGHAPDPPRHKELIKVEEVPEAEAGHDFRPVDLEGADRALAREIVALRQSAGGSSAADLGGRHASPEDTQPDLGETARHAKE